MSAPFGQPEYGSQSSENAQEPTQEQAPIRDNGQATQEAPKITDISSLEKFKFGDREFTPDQLRKAMMMHADYTKKSQEIAKERRFQENVMIDVRKVRQNPALAEEFLKVYPKSYHHLVQMAERADETRQDNRQESEGSGQNRSMSLPPEVMQRLSEVDTLKNYIRDQEVAKHEAQLDAKFAIMSKKYPDADEDSVLARAQALMDQDVVLNDQTWEKLWKSSHEKFQQKLQTKQKTTLDRQRAANGRAADTASTGGTPGQAPQKMGLKQVAEYAISDMKRRGV